MIAASSYLIAFSIGFIIAFTMVRWSPLMPPRPGYAISNGKWGSECEYRTIIMGIPHWTKRLDDAILFARVADANAFAEEDESAWQIVAVAQL